MQSGIRTLDEAFVKLIEEAPEPDEDEDELPEDYEPEMIHEAKDPYAHRSLPHVIGT
jgi:hypothetical protein